MNVSHIPTTKINKDHPKDQIIGDLNLAIQTRRMTKIFDEYSMVSYINKQSRTNHKDYQNCLFACFLSQKEPKKVIQALADPSWVEHARGIFCNLTSKGFGLLVDLPNGKERKLELNWVPLENMIYLKASMPLEQNGIEAIRLFLAHASFMGLIVYHMDVKNAFLYGTIEEEVYVCQPPGFEDPQFPNKVYKVYVDDIIFGSTKKSLCTEFESLMHKKFQMSSMGELTFFLGLQVMQRDDGIFISQDKYVADILKKFDFVTMKTTSTPIKTNKALLKDEEAKDVDVHLYRSMIGSLMYLTASRPDIMFAVYACARFQVTPKVSHLHAVKRIFRYLKGQPKLGLWYPRDSPFDLEAFSDSDYAGASLDRKSTTGAEYVAAANCCGQNLVFHSKTKHIEIRHHFIRDSYEKRLIQVIKIHTDHNVADLLTKAFDVSRDKFENKTGSCKVNAARQAKHIEYMSRMDGRTCNIKQKCVKSQTPRQAKRGRDTKIPQSGGPPEKVGDEAVYKGLGDRMDRAATTASSLEAEQDNGCSVIENPTIYVSLIHQFWQTASASTSKNEEMEITATIDGRVKTVTEASIRRHLKLGKFDVLVESHHSPTSALSTSQPPTSPPSMKTTYVAEEAATISHDSPLPRVHSLGSDEGSMTLHELTVLCTTLSKKVESLESALKQTKLTYGAAYSKLIMKVKKLENRIKSSKARRRVRLVVSEDKDDLEDPSKQGRKIAQLDEDERITLFTAPEEVYTVEPDISTANVPVSTAGAEVSTVSPEVKTAAKSFVYIRRSAAKRKNTGKAIMKEAEPVQKKTKLQLEQERLGYEEALRLQEQLDEEERQRISRVHKEANTFNAEE
ncbi:putative ribonuclease H-like domain-containing protein [Tanacetum coccineum]